MPKIALCLWLQDTVVERDPNSVFLCKHDFEFSTLYKVNRKKNHKTSMHYQMSEKQALFICSIHGPNGHPYHFTTCTISMATNQKIIKFGLKMAHFQRIGVSTYLEILLVPPIFP